MQLKGEFKMSTEASVIARKLRNYIVIENQKSRSEINSAQKSEPGIIKNILIISLMGLSVVFTQATLLLVKWTKHLGG